MQRLTCNLMKITVACFVLLTLYSCGAIRSTGRYPSKKMEAAYEQQYPSYYNGAFHSLYSPLDTASHAGVPRSKLRKELFGRFKRPRLSQPIPHVKQNLRDTVFTELTVVWFGHSSYLIQSNGFTILVDPVLSGHASPLWLVNRNYEGSNEYSLKDLPAVDMLLITHDHYDHLDYKTVRKLRKTVEKVVAPVGVGRTLDRWNVPEELTHEVYWGDTLTLADGVRLISTPAQHFSGRRFKRNKTLWTSYVLDMHGYRLFLGGDGGYNRHFKDIGDEYGPFDLAILENGQYSPYWRNSHAYPEQTAQAALDLRAKMVLPVHWAKFSATFHPWNEPVVRLLNAADSLGVQVTVPQIGEPYTVGSPPKRTVWWNFD